MVATKIREGWCGFVVQPHLMLITAAAAGPPNPQFTFRLDDSRATRLD